MLRLTILLQLLFVFAGTSKATAQSAGLNPAQIRQILRWKVQDRRRCRSYQGSGGKAGANDFRRRFPSCVEVYFSNDGFAAFFTADPGDLSGDQECYYSGYKLGFIEAYQTLWEGCGNDLSKALAAANTAATEQCKRLGLSLSAQRLEAERVLRQPDSSAAAGGDEVELAKIYVLSRTGDYREAWDRIVSLQATRQIGIAPCLLLLQKTLN